MAKHNPKPPIPYSQSSRYKRAQKVARRLFEGERLGRADVEKWFGLRRAEAVQTLALAKEIRNELTVGLVNWPVVRIPA